MGKYNMPHLSDFFMEKDKTQKLVCKNDSLGQSIYMVYL